MSFSQPSSKVVSEYEFPDKNKPDYVYIASHISMQTVDSNNIRSEAKLPLPMCIPHSQ